MEDIAEATQSSCGQKRKLHSKKQQAAVCVKRLKGFPYMYYRRTEDGSVPVDRGSRGIQNRCKHNENTTFKMSDTVGPIFARPLATSNESWYMMYFGKWIRGTAGAPI